MVTKGGCQGWFRQRSNLEKTLLSLSSILTLTLLLLILVGVAFHGTSSDNGKLKEETDCSSPECISTAGRILSKMNELVDPCTDFYQHACGNYGQATGETNSVEQSSVDSVYLSLRSMFERTEHAEIENIDRIELLYNRCMDFEGLHRVRAEVAKVLLNIMETFGVGSWPVVMDTTYKDLELSLSDRLASLTMIGVPVAFQVKVIPDPFIKGTYMLKISPGGPLEKARNYTDIIKDDYLRTYMLHSFFLVGTPNYVRATDAVDEILSVEAYYAKVDQDESNKKCNSVDIVSPDESLSKLNDLMPEMNWTSLILKIQKESGLQRPFAVEVHCKSMIRDYLVHLEDILDKQLDYYLGWRFFESFAKHIVPAFRRRTLNHQEAIPRWKECIKLVEKYAAPTVAKILARTIIKEESEPKQVSEMANSIQTVAERMVSGMNLLNATQKSKILRQVRQADIHIPYMKWINVSLDLQLPDMNMEDYTAAIIQLRRQQIIRKFKSLNPSIDTKEKETSWEIPLTSESAKPMSTSLEIYFDKLIEPYFTLHASKWMNMGGLGSFISRHLVKNILSLPVDLSMEQQTSVWDVISNNTISDSCIINFFNELVGSTKMVGGDTVLKELILDALSLEMAFESSQMESSFRKTVLPGLEAISDEQLFFIAYTQTQCNGKLKNLDFPLMRVQDRVNSVVMSSPAFNKAFSCSQSTSRYHHTCPSWI